MTRLPRPDPAAISVGPWSRLYSEDHFIKALKPLGMTRRAFRALLRALSVPYWEVGRTRLIDALSFSIALRAILRVGEPAFLSPGCDTLRRGKAPPRTRTSIDEKYIRQNLTSCIAELLAARELHGLTSPSATLMKAAADATSRLIRAGIASLPFEAQELHTTQSLETHDPNIPLKPLETPIPPLDGDLP